ncbi:MAG: SRPBCC family protein [Dysgonamonadaceae bacterium]|jgi:carbon monoxide dehydrogenase subunit G|nr:SRPBCC family protein [Dysgonamonadaceae bacterium]
MTEFTSEIKQLPHSGTTVYEVLSDLSNLEKLKEQLPDSKIQAVTFERDYCTFNISAVGNVRVTIVEREPGKTIKFTADQSPIEFYLWIQLKEVDSQSTRIKLTLKAELNPVLKPMVSGMLQTGLDQIADVLAAIPYETLGKKH